MDERVSVEDLGTMDVSGGEHHAMAARPTLPGNGACGAARG
ncbi:hypothetical protein [Nocardiopsis listeri]|nr:hypothetical protein [Nocardiopsis listeri]